MSIIIKDHNASMTYRKITCQFTWWSSVKKYVLIFTLYRLCQDAKPWMLHNDKHYNNYDEQSLWKLKYCINALHAQCRGFRRTQNNKPWINETVWSRLTGTDESSGSKIKTLHIHLPLENHHHDTHIHKQPL